MDLFRVVKDGHGFIIARTGIKLYPIDPFKRFQLDITSNSRSLYEEVERIRPLGFNAYRVLDCINFLQERRASYIVEFNNLDIIPEELIAELKEQS